MLKQNGLDLRSIPLNACSRTNVDCVIFVLVCDSVSLLKHFVRIIIWLIDTKDLELEPILALGLIGVQSGVTSSRPNRRV